MTSLHLPRNLRSQRAASRVTVNATRRTSSQSNQHNPCYKIIFVVHTTTLRLSLRSPTMGMRASSRRPSLVLGLIWLVPGLGYELNVGPSARYDPSFARSLSQRSAARQPPADALWTPRAGSLSSSGQKSSLLWTMGGESAREPMRMMPQQTPMVPYMVRSSAKHPKSFWIFLASSALSPNPHLPRFFSLAPRVPVRAVHRH
jgi:hypothetical protein